MSLLLNICKYEQCGKIFPSLSKLIAHIESTHINFNPQVVEFLEKEKPVALPLSYVLPSGVVKPKSGKVLKVQLQQLMASRAAAASASCSTETADEAETEAENDDDCGGGENGGENGGGGVADNDGSSVYGGLDSDEDLIAEFIMRYGRKPIGNELEEKPYACPVPGCMKRYKNANGIKYHSKHGHRKNSKPYECYCGKGYKTNQGLKNHMSLTHNSILGLDVVVTTPEQSISSPPDTSRSSLETLNITTLETLPSSFDELCQIDQVLNASTTTTNRIKHDSTIDTTMEANFTVNYTEQAAGPSQHHTVTEASSASLNNNFAGQSNWDGVVDMRLPFEETEEALAEAFATIDDIIDVGDVNDSMF